MTQATPPKKPRFEWGGKSFYLRALVIVLISAWMFILGILVGRGTAPVQFDVEKLQKELIALKEAVIQKELSRIPVESEEGVEKTRVDFYEELKSDRRDPQPETVASSPPPPPSAAKPAPVASDTATGAFTIQVASLKEAKLADRMVADLKAKGYPAFKAEASVPGKGTWYRVRVGAFAVREQAAGMLQQLQGDQLKGFVVRQ